MAVKNLTERRDIDDFFSKLRKGDIIIYHPSYDIDDIVKLGIEYKWHIEYCGPGTPQYEKYGVFTCKVIDKMSANMRILPPIDAAVIATNFDKSWVSKKALKNFK